MSVAYYIVLSHYSVCRVMRFVALLGLLLIRFVASKVCRIIGFIALLGLLHYEVYPFMGFVAYAVC